MDKLQYVVGTTNKNEPAVIRFYDSVDRYSTERFNEEFLWLQDCVKPSKITVLINSEGGSVIHGMSTYSIIQSCPIPVDCVIEGIAASMGSVIWAAGKNLYMHDYSILMIHNPFVYFDQGDEDTKAMLEAFREQIATVYQNRFCLSEDKVKEIMDGKEGVDGTYLNATKAVEAGIIPTTNIISTAKSSLISNAMDEVLASKTLDVVFLRKTISNKLLNDMPPITQVEQINLNNKTTMNEINVNLVAAQLGLKEGTEAQVTARINELVEAEKRLTAITDEKNELAIKLQGKEQEAKNFKEELDQTKAELQVFKDKEAAAKEAEIEAYVQSAIDSQKIDADSKESWIEAARTNFGIVRATLDSIQGKQKISEEIATDKANQNDAIDALDKKLNASVEAIIGKSFEFKKF